MRRPLIRRRMASPMRPPSARLRPVAMRQRRVRTHARTARPSPCPSATTSSRPRPAFRHAGGAPPAGYACLLPSGILAARRLSQGTRTQNRQGRASAWLWLQGLDRRRLPRLWPLSHPPSAGPRPACRAYGPCESIGESVAARSTRPSPDLITGCRSASVRRLVRRFLPRGGAPTRRRAPPLASAPVEPGVQPGARADCPLPASCLGEM